MSDRNLILARIRERLGRSESEAAARRAAVQVRIGARAQGPRPRANGDLAGVFRDRAVTLASTCEYVADLSDVPAAVARYLAEHALPSRAVCWRTLVRLGWVAAGLDVEARSARGDDAVGITGAYCALAETGTLVVLSGPDTPGSVSLLPETHVAVVPCNRIVQGMEDAWALMRDERIAMPRAVNFVSGPSRTADIEQTVTLGAHGPARVHVVLVG
jgi:L-lactate dehydrogenase complex protein LldG